ncbi:protein artichoke isoform X2 [Neocloeon triangulifer]|uniref:protein artichoke isoform X2 n=1 Tax=Neocloeon triangulifer TaxID=2078957 RepID=UPI00286F479D|nr:protein artichoke isoform X2 [Neocloeon triangulifer]
MKPAKSTVAAALLALLLALGAAQQTLDESECPPDTAILPCRCRMRDPSSEIQIWCSHSDLPRVMAPLRAIAENKPGAKIDELILEGNQFQDLPDDSLQGLSVVRLMLRENSLERLAASALFGQEKALTELYIVEPKLNHLAAEIFSPLIKLQAITMQTPFLRRLPIIKHLPELKYLRIEDKEVGAWRNLVLIDLPELQDLHLTCGERGLGLDKLETGMIQGTPRLQTVEITKCGLAWVHPHAFTSTSQKIESIDLSDNYLDDVGQIALAVRELPMLSELKLDRNNFRGLPEGSLVSLMGLRYLSLSGNQIREVGPGAFHILPNLEVLDLSNNNLMRLHPQAFTPRAAPRMQELNLARNSLGHLGEVRPWMATLTSLVRLDVSENGINELAWAALGPHPNLERLNLDGNRIQMVRRDALSALPALIDLKMRNNSIDEYLLLERGSPWNLPSLKGLDLGQNGVRFLDARLLAGLPSLRRLDLSQNLLNELQGSPFSPSPMIEHLNLSYNGLQALPQASLSPLRAIYEMDISHNKLLSLPVTPGRALDQMGVLNIEGNQLGTIPEGWTSGQSTHTLQLSGNSLRSVPRLNLPGLTRLDISRNLISRMDLETLSSARELVYLNASHNELDSFPSGLRGLASLRELDLNDNRLSSLPAPEVLGSLQSLRILRLARNQLTQLPSDSLHGLPRLTSLALSENRINEIDRSALADLPSLAELDLSKNAISALPRGAFSQMPSLRAVSLQGNALEEFHATAFEGAPRLLLLDLSHNHIQHADWGRNTGARSLKPTSKEIDLLPAAMPGLEVLDLSHNRLRTLEDAGVTNLPWLVELKVNNNEICGIGERSLEGLSRLRVLSLRNNKVKMMQERAFRALRSNMVHLDVAGNPLSCTCGLMWFQEWIDVEPRLQPHIHASESPRCADGSLLREVALSRSLCQEKQQRDGEDLLAKCLEKNPNSVSAYESHEKPSNSPLTSPGQPGRPYYDNQPGQGVPDDFYDDFVDYPHGGGSENLQQTTTQGPPAPQPIDSTPTVSPQSSSHYTPGDTPTFYAGSINLTSLNPQPPPLPNNGPFTVFGYPLPSISSLWNNGNPPANGIGRTSAKRLETSGQNNQAGPKLFEEGFVPSVGPQRPPWVFSESNETFKFQQKEFHKQDHKLKFPAPTVNSKGPFDYRGSLPIRDDPPQAPLSTSSPVPQPLNPTVVQKGVLPLVFAEADQIPKTQEMRTTLRPTDATTTPDFSKLFPQEDDYQSGPSYPSGEEYPTGGANNFTLSSKGSQDNSSLANQVQNSNNAPSYKEKMPEVPKSKNFSYIEQVTNTTSSKTYTITSNEIRNKIPVIPPSANPLENTIVHQFPTSAVGSVVPTVPPTAGGHQSSRATITKVENSKNQQNKYVTVPTLPPTSEPTMTTVHSWYYRDYNKTNLEPFRGEYLQDLPLPSGTTAVRGMAFVMATLSAGLLIFMY